MRASKHILIGIPSALAVIMAIVALVWYLVHRSTRDLEVQASRAIVAWVFEDQPITGFESGYVGLSQMCRATRWYVICDFLPQDVSLSDNPRIERVSEGDGLEILEQESDGSENSSFLVIHLRSASRNKVVLAMLTAYGGGLGGHMYEFTFTLADGQLNGIGWYAGGP